MLFQNLALFLCGVSDRLASRIEENWGLASKGTKSCPYRILMGFSDEGRFFVFGSSVDGLKSAGLNHAELREAFETGDCAFVRNTLVSILSESKYISWKEVDDLGNMMPFMRANYAQLVLAMRSSYASILEQQITKQESVWITDQPVMLIVGDIVSPYLCIHSVTQIRGIYKDISRLIRIISNEFEFDFVLSVGTAARTSVARDLVNYKLRFRPSENSRSSSRMFYYSYQDYFSFDHGEDPASAIPLGSRVLIIVDGIRKSENCDEQSLTLKTAELMSWR